MMNKLADLSVVICVVIGGLSIALVHRTDVAMFAVLGAIGIVVMLLYSILLKREKYPETAFHGANYIISVCAVISASVSSSVAVSLVTDTDVLDKNYLPLTVTLVAVFVFCIAFSSAKSLPKTVTATVIFVSIVLIILIFLCITQSELSAVNIGSINYKLLIPLAAFSICDVVFILPHINTRSKNTLILGIALCFVYMSAMSMIALSVLSDSLFYEFNMPLMKLWQSTYIASFLSRFETVAVCSFFILCAIKSGLLLNRSLKVFGNTCFYMIAVLYLGSTVSILMFPNLVHFAALLSIICGIVFPLVVVIKKC